MRGEIHHDLWKDPNNYYQSETRFTTICEDGNFKDWNWEVWWIQVQFLKDVDWRLFVPERSSRTPVGGEVGYYDHRAVEAQESSGLKVDPVKAVQKRGVQHHQGQDIGDALILSVHSSIQSWILDQVHLFIRFQIRNCFGISSLKISRNRILPTTKLWRLKKIEMSA